AGGLGQLGEADAAAVVDAVGEPGPELAERVVRQLGEVDDGVDALEVLGADVADVDDVGAGPLRSAGGVEPALAVEAGIDADDLVAVGEELGGEHRADVTVDTGDEQTQSHQSFHTFQGGAAAHMSLSLILSRRVSI